MSRPSVKVFFPKIKLQELLARPGGVTRDDAIAAATTNMRSISGEGDAVIEAAIVAIEQIAARSSGNRLPHDDMKAILVQADQIVTFAGTFGYASLDQATRDLCDIADGLIQSGLFDAAPISVHVRAIRLLAPASTPLQPPEVKQVLAELAKVKAHYNFASMGS